MKVVYVASGAAGMYCGSCMHSNTTAAALAKQGQDVLLVPAYTPIRTDEENVSIDRMVFGGVNVYLQQKSSLFRHTPWLLDRLLDRPWLLRRLGGRGVSTQAEALGPLTVSMLQGEHGRQRKELEKLLLWLEREIRPDVVHLSNALLIGMASRLGRCLDVPVVCTLSGEDVFLGKLPEPYCTEARSLLHEQCAHVAALVAFNRYYAGFMAEYLGVGGDCIHVIPPGLNLDGHGSPAGPPTDDRTKRPNRQPFTIGYLGRVCPEKGLHLLAEAFALLCEDRQLPPLRLVAGGYLGKADRPYLTEIRSGLAERGLAGQFQYLGELDRRAKIGFLQTLDVMSVPTVHPESKGLSVLEAWANAVPAVLPAHGAFPELIEDTGGGLLCRPCDPGSLAAGLKELLAHPGRAAEWGRRGQQAVRERYHAELMARRMVQLYESLVGGPKFS